MFVSFTTILYKSVILPALTLTLTAFAQTLVALALTFIALDHLNSTDKMHQLYCSQHYVKKTDSGKS